MKASTSPIFWRFPFDSSRTGRSVYHLEPVDQLPGERAVIEAA